MIRDLAEISVSMVRQEHLEKIQEKAKHLAEERLLDLLLPQPRLARTEVDEQERERSRETRERLREQLRGGKLDSRYVDIEVKEKVMPFGVISNAGLEEIEINLKSMLGNLLPEKAKRKKAKVPEALTLLEEEEANKLLDMDKITREAVERVNRQGLFLDEIDKIAVIITVMA
jgi:ATP-dependent HslUV protease ATP-binding subunit HslU